METSYANRFFLLLLMTILYEGYCDQGMSCGNSPARFGHNDLTVFVIVCMIY